MSSPSRVLHVLSRMGRGGAEIRTLELMRHLDRRRFRFHFCALSGRRGELDDEMNRLGGQVHLVPRDGPGFSRRFRALLREHCFDVVHSQVLYFSGYVLRLAAAFGTPVRVAQFQNSHDSRRGPHRWIVRSVMRRWIDRYATHVTAVSEGAMASVWGRDWKSDPRCRLLYNGVDPARFAAGGDRDGVCREFGLPCDAPLCIHVGRIARQKNHLRLVRIFAELLRRRPQARLLLVGRGGNSLEKRLRSRIARLGIGGRVLLCGERADVPRLLGTADVLLFPSRWEGLPGVVQEAAAAGTPVVASDLPGVGELAERLAGIRRVGLDKPDSHWAEVVADVLACPVPEHARTQARRAFEQSEFAIDRCAEKYCRIWEGHAPEPASSFPLPDRRAA